MTETHKPQIRLNGDDTPLTASTIEALLDSMDIGAPRAGVAVALNGSVVPRAAWARTLLNSGDTVEVVRARHGG